MFKIRAECALKIKEISVELTLLRIDTIPPEKDTEISIQAQCLSFYKCQHKSTHFRRPRLKTNTFFYYDNILDQFNPSNLR